MPRLHPVRRSSRAARESGFSYVEGLLTVLLLSLGVGGVLPLLTGGEESYQELRRRQEMIQNARVALDKFLRELRVAESFRVLSPATIRFTLFWGDGSGASPTAEYVLNGATGDLEYRWSADWDYRRQITVTAADAVAAGYAVGLTANHAAPGGAANKNPPPPTRGPRAGRPPPQNGDNIFLDYENGTTLGGWTRRDAEAGGYGGVACGRGLFPKGGGSGGGGP